MALKVADQVERAALPEWIRILPLGQVELSDSREPFEVDEASLSSMVAAFRSRGVDLVIDYEHQSLQGERAPAAGWIKDLEARPDGLWARVEWTRQAQEYLLSKEYRYFSPVLRLDPATRRPMALMHLGLTNVPAIKRLPPLVAK
jgi:phage I-like protein